MNSQTDFFFNKEDQWQAAYQQLRTLVLDCGLTEELKWGTPCYTFQGANIVLIHGFKEYCALLFFKGALLQDPQGILVAQSENTQATRQIRFRSADEIVVQASVLKTYIFEAVEVEKAGLKVDFKKTAEFGMPEEFQQKLDEMPALKMAFAALTPGRQRGYLLHFSAPKQSQTRTARVEKWAPHILAGKGLND